MKRYSCVWEHGMGKFFSSLNEHILFSWIDTVNIHEKAVVPKSNLVSLLGIVVKVKTMPVGEN